MRRINGSSAAAAAANQCNNLVEVDTWWQRCEDENGPPLGKSSKFNAMRGKGQKSNVNQSVAAAGNGQKQIPRLVKQSQSTPSIMISSSVGNLSSISSASPPPPAGGHYRGILKPAGMRHSAGSTGSAGSETGSSDHGGAPASVPHISSPNRGRGGLRSSVAGNGRDCGQKPRAASVTPDSEGRFDFRHLLRKTNHAPTDTLRKCKGMSPPERN